MFLETLPDPNFTINTAGIAGGAAGPGFMSTKIGLVLPIQQDRAIAGRTTRRTQKQAKWDISIAYNPLTQVEFAPIYYFLMEKKGSRKPFYVSLPQYHLPKDPTLATYVQSNPIAITSDPNAAGLKSLEIETPSGAIQAGDVFNISDPNDSLHTQVYMISHVETAALNETPPTAGSVRVHFFPGLQRDTTTASDIIFDTPVFKVTQKQDIQEYSLDTENLYSFSLKLEEALY
jgi:hypothetical protein